MLGRGFKSTYHLRLLASRTEPNRHWHAVLVSDDERYVIAHAQQLVAVPEVRARLEQEGLPVDNDLLAILADAPPMGLAPVPADSKREVVVIQGDASFRASNREALSLAAELRGDIDDAVDHMRRAVAHEPTKPLWHFKLGALLAAAGGVDEGMAECRIAAAMEPTWDIPRIEVGVTLLNARRPMGALLELLAARDALAEPTPHLRYHLGLAHLDVGDVPEAAPCFEAVLDAKPGDPWASNMLAEALFALVEGQAGQERRATTARALRLAKDAALKGRARALGLWQQRRGNQG